MCICLFVCLLIFALQLGYCSCLFPFDCSGVCTVNVCILYCLRNVNPSVCSANRIRLASMQFWMLHIKGGSL